MTALERYVRLEAIGLWREGPGARPREVIVAFGQTTLVLKDLAERPLGHWALAGIAAIGREGGATVYSMTAGGEETLAIRDRDMVAAIAAVARGDRCRPPHRAAAGARVGGGGGGRGARRRRLARAGPGARPGRAHDAARARRRVRRPHADRAGRRPRRPLHRAGGERALARIAARLAPERPPEVRVLDLGAAPAAALPGGALLLGRGTLAAAAAPEALAGWLAVALGREPFPALMRDAGPAATLRYVLTGDFTDEGLARGAEAALAPPTPEEIPPAMARLAAAGIDARPFAAAMGLTGLPPPAAAEPLLSDRDWADLRGICG